MGRALTMGDEMHQRNIAATLLLLREVAPLLAQASLPSDRHAAVVAFMGQTDQFFLNVAMAACKAIADAGHAAGAESSLVTAMSRNGMTPYMNTGPHHQKIPRPVASTRPNAMNGSVGTSRPRGHR